MVQPQGFVDKQQPDYVCKLQKSLYGLKQAPRAWNARFTSFLPTLGFVQTIADSSLFVRHNGSTLVLLLLYVDDIIITGTDSNTVQQVIDQLSKEFDMKNLGILHFFLGLQVKHLADGLFISQSKYVIDILTKADMLGCKTCDSPCVENQKLTNEGSLPYKDPQHYRSMVGALQYLTFTKPDISFSVQQVCQFMSTPLDSHYAAVKRILRYLSGTIQYGLHYTHSSLQLQIFSDSDWAACPITRRSISGFVVFLGSSPISWSCKKQTPVSRSSTEAEYRAMANSTAEIIWIQQLLTAMQVSLPQIPIMFCDNQSAMALASNPVQHSRAKHIEIDCHFVREQVTKGAIKLQYVPTDKQVADVLTKGLGLARFAYHCNNLRLGFSHPGIEGEC